MKKVYQVQVNPRKCGWMEIATFSSRERAEEEMAETKERSKNNPDFEHRIIEIVIDSY